MRCDFHTVTVLNNSDSVDLHGLKRKKQIVMVKKKKKQPQSAVQVLFLQVLTFLKETNHFPVALGTAVGTHTNTHARTHAHKRMSTNTFFIDRVGIISPLRGVHEFSRIFRSSFSFSAASPSPARRGSSSPWQSYLLMVTVWFRAAAARGRFDLGLGAGEEGGLGERRSCSSSPGRLRVNAQFIESLRWCRVSAVGGSGERLQARSVVRIRDEGCCLPSEVCCLHRSACCPCG